MEAEASLNQLIIRVAKAHRQQAATLLAGLGLYPGQEFILLRLQQNNGLSQNQLAEFLGVQPPTISKMLQRMEAAGLLQRVPSPTDQRVTLVYLSAKGQALLPDLHRAWDQLEHTFASTLDSVELAQLKLLLQQVANRVHDPNAAC